MIDNIVFLQEFEQLTEQQKEIEEKIQDLEANPPRYIPHMAPELRIRCVKLTSIDTACVISLPNPMFDHLLESSR